MNYKPTYYIRDSRDLTDCVDDNSINLVITSPPYFNVKDYSDKPTVDLGNINHYMHWKIEMKKVWKEVYRVLQPGRRFFLNITNISVKEGNTFKTLNLVGDSINMCSDVGFVFKKDIIWQKTNGMKAPFGSYPYPGGILVNHMHEYILEFVKPIEKKEDKLLYRHITDEVKEESKLTKAFWLSLKNTDVWLMKPSPKKKDRKHVAPFPLELPERLIKAYSFIDEKILDPFAGSGTTLVAAYKNKRIGIGCDINGEEYQNDLKDMIDSIQK